MKLRRKAVRQSPIIVSVGRVQRQAKRCLLAHNGRTTTTEIRRWCYPRDHKHWHYTEVRRALRQLGAEQVGRGLTRGRPGIWSLSVSHTERR
jgi:hypothetical protein